MNKNSIYITVIIVLFGLMFMLSGCSAINEWNDERLTADISATQREAITAARAIQEENSDLFYFRDTVWGMTTDEVIAVAGEPNEHDEKTLCYNATDIFGYDTAIIRYNFDVDGKLYGGDYQFNELYSNKNQYITDYYDLQKRFIKDYGKPDFDEVIWYDEHYKEDENQYGLAVSVGHLEYTTIWKRGDSSFSIRLYAENNKMIMQILCSYFEFE